MHPSERYDLISPLDHRYFFANEALFRELTPWLSEAGAVRASVRVEAALLAELVTRLRPELAERADIADAIATLPETIDPAEVYREEETTRHNIRAVVNVLQRHLADEVRPLVHLGATSMDILDTAAAYRYRGVVRAVVLPLLARLQERLTTMVEAEADRTAIGRTHGQHAVPITVGFAFAEYAHRLAAAIEQIEAASGELRGKLSGAVGAYNATALLVDDPVELERAVLARLGLTAGGHATQIVEPEPLLRLLLEMNIAFGIIANLADDLRHLQRSEIGELQEFFAPGQVGSSTMPHKRNPWNAEHVKSLWKAFAPRAMAWFMDQISEHQRDLTNSASARFHTEYVAGFVAAAARLLSVLEKIDVDAEGVAANLAAGTRRIVAEPLYILLAAGGVADAHERVRALTLEADRSGRAVIDLARDDADLWAHIESGARASRVDAAAILADPAQYTGRAADRARAVAADCRARIAALRTRLDG